jgi:hypothetical protein
MPNDPPWEWVDGDSVRSSQFRVVFYVIRAGFAAFVFAAFFVLLATWSVGTGFPLVAMTLLAVGLPLLFAGLFVLFYMARRYPVIDPLGISSKGVRLMLPNRGGMYYWGEVSRVGPDWIEVSPLGIIDTRYKLTTNQIQRVYRFLQAH